MKTTVFLDPMTSHYWFLMNGELQCAIAVIDTHQLSPKEVGNPEAAKEYHCDFIKQLLTDDEYQLSFNHLFFTADTKLLASAIEDRSVTPIDLTIKYSS